MSVHWGAALLIVLGCGLALLHLTRRAPRCPSCGTRAEPVSVPYNEGRIPVIELAHWCPRCARVISRRFVTPLWEW